MGFDKTVRAQLFSVVNQKTDVRLPIGTSTGGTHTSKVNPMRGTLLWDRGMYVLQGVSVDGGATGSSFVVTVETDAVVGFTGLPIASATLGFGSTGTIVLDSLHQSAASPLPTHLNITVSAGGAGGSSCWLTCHGIARQYRGTLGTPGMKSAERVLQGPMLNIAGVVPLPTDSDIYTLGTSGSDLGMHRMSLWDNALFWVVAGSSVSGTHDFDIIAPVGGVTTSIATTGTGGALDTGGERLALANNFYGQCPNPSQIIWTEVTAGGVSDTNIVMLAKSGRGSMAKS